MSPRGPRAPAPNPYRRYPGAGNSPPPYADLPDPPDDTEDDGAPPYADLPDPPDEDGGDDGADDPTEDIHGAPDDEDDDDDTEDDGDDGAPPYADLPDQDDGGGDDTEDDGEDGDGSGDGEDLSTLITGQGSGDGEGDKEDDEDDDTDLAEVITGQSQDDGEEDDDDESDGGSTVTIIPVPGSGYDSGGEVSYQEIGGENIAGTIVDGRFVPLDPVEHAEAVLEEAKAYAEQLAAQYGDDEDGWVPHDSTADRARESANAAVALAEAHLAFARDAEILRLAMLDIDAAQAEQDAAWDDFVTDLESAGGYIEVDPDTGAQTIVTPSQARWAAWRQSIIEAGGGIVTDPATGQTIVLSPTDIAWKAWEDKVVAGGGQITTDPATGQTTVVTPSDIRWKDWETRALADGATIETETGEDGKETSVLVFPDQATHDRYMGEASTLEAQDAEGTLWDEFETLPARADDPVWAGHADLVEQDAIEGVTTNPDGTVSGPWLSRLDRLVETDQALSEQRADPTALYHDLYGDPDDVASTGRYGDLLTMGQDAGELHSSFQSAATPSQALLDYRDRQRRQYEDEMVRYDPVADARMLRDLERDTQMDADRWIWSGGPEALDAWLKRDVEDVHMGLDSPYLRSQIAAARADADRWRWAGGPEAYDEWLKRGVEDVHIGLDSPELQRQIAAFEAAQMMQSQRSDSAIRAGAGITPALMDISRWDDNPVLSRSAPDVFAQDVVPSGEIRPMTDQEKRAFDRRNQVRWIRDVLGIPINTRQGLPPLRRDSPYIGGIDDIFGPIGFYTNPQPSTLDKALMGGELALSVIPGWTVAGKGIRAGLGKGKAFKDAGRYTLRDISGAHLLDPQSDVIDDLGVIARTTLAQPLPTTLPLRGVTALDQTHRVRAQDVFGVPRIQSGTPEADTLKQIADDLTLKALAGEKVVVVHNGIEYSVPALDNPALGMPFAGHAGPNTLNLGIEDGMTIAKGDDVTFVANPNKSDAEQGTFFKPNDVASKYTQGSATGYAGNDGQGFIYLLNDADFFDDLVLTNKIYTNKRTGQSFGELEVKVMPDTTWPVAQTLDVMINGKPQRVIVFGNKPLSPAQVTQIKAGSIGRMATEPLTNPRVQVRQVNTPDTITTSTPSGSPPRNTIVEVVDGQPYRRLDDIIGDPASLGRTATSGRLSTGPTIRSYTRSDISSRPQTGRVESGPGADRSTTETEGEIRDGTPDTRPPTDGETGRPPTGIDGELLPPPQGDGTTRGGETRIDGERLPPPQGGVPPRFNGAAASRMPEPTIISRTPADLDISRQMGAGIQERMAREDIERTIANIQEGIYRDARDDETRRIEEDGQRTWEDQDGRQLEDRGEDPRRIEIDGQRTWEDQDIRQLEDLEDNRQLPPTETPTTRTPTDLPERFTPTETPPTTPPTTFPQRFTPTDTPVTPPPIPPPVTPPPPTRPPTPPPVPPPSTPTMLIPGNVDVEDVKRRKAAGLDYPEVVAWRQGEFFKVWDTDTDIVTTQKDPPPGVPETGDPFVTYRVLSRDDDPPISGVYEMGVVNVTADEDGISFAANEKGKRKGRGKKALEGKGKGRGKKMLEDKAKDMDQRRAPVDRDRRKQPNGRRPLTAFREKAPTQAMLNSGKR